ncbi:hypothetical protein [Arthrobacter sp. UYCu723]
MAVVVMKVPVSGRLEEWATGIAGYLAVAGYAPTSIVLRVRLFAHLSRWCDAETLLPTVLDAAAIDRFLVARRASHVDLSSPVTLAPVVSFLRSIGAVPPAPEPQDGAVGAEEALLDRWGAFLLSEQALVPSTVNNYRALAEPFVTSRLRGSVLEGDTVDATVVAGFVAATIPKFSIGVVADRLDAVVPGRAGYRDAGLPRGVTAEQVAMMVAATGGDSVVRRRDRAVLAVLSRVALRAVFCRSRAPFTALSVSGIQGIVRHAGRRAGLGAVGAHRLRHTVATATINAGASLEEVA